MLVLLLAVDTALLHQVDPPLAIAPLHQVDLHLDIAPLHQVDLHLATAPLHQVVDLHPAIALLLRAVPVSGDNSPFL